MKKLKYSQYNKFDITPFGVLIFAGIIVVCGTVFFAKVLNTIKTLPKELPQTETQVQPEQEPEPEEEEVQEEPEQEQEPEQEEDNSDLNDTPQPVHKEVSKPTPVVEPKPVVQQPTIVKPKNVIDNPEEYLDYVYNKLSKALPRYNTGGYTIDCTIVLTSQRNIEIREDGWNGDVGHNFIFYNLDLIPKYYDANGRIVPIVIKFKAHSIESVRFCR